ncbi:MAG: hypothetical protein A2Y33_01585 [Spirochaetes bacterium GWF1_51_8]|nr:MAG: hypothetical protein A2Y33_01585 [Spirochaetes bacterium GWF1_51_8]
MVEKKPPLVKRLKARAKKLKDEITVLRIALHDNETPWYSKALVALTVAYALSPIDLIPDFIPVLGLLDDIILLPAMIALAIKTIPSAVMERSRIKAEERKSNGKKNYLAAVIIILIWLLAGYLFFRFIIELFGKPI